MAKQILVVDDEPTICQLFTLVLEADGYDVTVTGDGADAKKLLKERQFDLVFLDLILPDCHGSDVLNYAKTLPRVPVVCVVTAMSATDYERVKDYMKMIRWGAKDKFLRKPLDRTAILAATKELLGVSETGGRT